MKEKMNKAKAAVLKFFFGMADRRLTVYAASGCYYLVVSLVPIVMLLCCLLPYTPFSQHLVLSYVDQLFMPTLASLVRRMVSAVYASNAGTLTVSVVLTVFLASASMRALILGLDAAYDYHKSTPYLIFFFKGFVLMLVLILSMFLAIAVLVYGDELWDLAVSYLGTYDILLRLLKILRLGVVQAILALVFALIYTIIPSVHGNFFRQLPGAIFTLGMWMLFSWAFSLYVRVFNKYGAYGYIGAVLVVMLWFYWCIFILLAGGYVNSLFSRLFSRSGVSAAESEEEK